MGSREVVKSWPAFPRWDDWELKEFVLFRPLFTFLQFPRSSIYDVGHAFAPRVKLLQNLFMKDA